MLLHIVTTVTVAILAGISTGRFMLWYAAISLSDAMEYQQRGTITSSNKVLLRPVLWVIVSSSLWIYTGVLIGNAIWATR